MFAQQNHVDVTALTTLHPEWCGVEYFACGCAARIIAENRQRLPAQQGLHRCQVNAVALEVAIRRVMAKDAALVVEQIHLDAGIDRHQLAEQCAHFAVTHAARVHQFTAACDVIGQALRQTLHGFQFMHAGAAHLYPCERTTAHQQQAEEHRRQALRQRQADHAPPSPASTSL
ncbi:hypothetical protein D3C81_1044620 [compost metagenome]